MSDSESATPTEESVKSSYIREFHRFLQRHSGTKPVSQGYIEAKCGKLDARDATGASFWQKLLGYCLAHHLEPSRLSKAFFQSKQNASNFALIKHEQIFNTSTMVEYEKLRPGVDYCKDSLKKQITALETYTDMQWHVSGVEPDVSAGLTLSVLTSNYCPLFRYCTLKKLGYDPAPWLIAAIRQYSPDRESYDKAWADYIPDEIRVTATKKRNAS